MDLCNLSLDCMSGLGLWMVSTEGNLITDVGYILTSQVHLRIHQLERGED